MCRIVRYRAAESLLVTVNVASDPFSVLATTFGYQRDGLQFRHTSVQLPIDVFLGVRIEPGTLRQIVFYGIVEPIQGVTVKFVRRDVSTFVAMKSAKFVRLVDRPLAVMVKYQSFACL
jgi:hypothetical protein